MIKFIGVLSILLSLSTPAFCGVISSTYLENGHKVNTYKYFYEGDVFKRCNQKNDCDYLFNKDKNYCNNILKLKNEDDIQVRMRWECPRYESIKTLEKHNIFLSKDPAFTDYTFNLDKVFSNEKKTRKNEILFEKLSLKVGISPNNIFIPYDMNDEIKKIRIHLNNKNYVLSEEYEMGNGTKFFRQYFYKNNDIEKILEVKKDKSSKILFTNEMVYRHENPNFYR